jgi:ABC-type multidrug transport system fused ATPase/permease subunit
MGLVMQEPILFNYTIRENILYGKSDAKESEIEEAAEISNAMEFINSSEIDKALEDSPTVFKRAFIENKE